MSRSNTGTVEVVLKLNDKGVVRGFREVSRESEKTAIQGRKSFKSLDDGAAGFNNRLISIKGGVTALMSTFVMMEAVQVFNRINTEGMALESTMKRTAAVSRANLETYEQLTAAARAAGAATEWQARQAGQALQFEAMAGMEAQDAVKGLPDLLDLATAAQEELGIASDIVTDNLTAFKMHISQLPRLNDAFINTTIRSNTTVQMLGESFKYTAPVAAQMGYNVEQTAAYLGVMANSGIKASDAGTDLRQILLRTADAAEKLGLDAGASLIDVLEEMYDRQMSANEVTDLFGILASKSAMVLMSNVEAYKKLNRELEENEGATRSLAREIRDSAENDWKVMISAISEAGLKMYDMYEEDWRSLIRGITDEVNDNAAAFEAMGDAISGVLNVMEGMASAGGWVMEKVGRIGEWASLQGKAQGMASGGMFARSLITSSNFEELRSLVELGEKAMSGNQLEKQTARAELLRMEIEQIENKLSTSIFYPQGTHEKLAFMKAQYEKITREVEAGQALKHEEIILEQNAAMYAKAAAEQTEASQSAQSEWVKAYEKSVQDGIKLTLAEQIKAEEEKLARYRKTEKIRPELVAAAEKQIAELKEKARKEERQQTAAHLADVEAALDQEFADIEAHEKAVGETQARFHDEYLRATLDQYDYERHVLEEKYADRSERAADKSALDKWYAAEKADIDKRETEGHRRNLEAQTREQEKQLEEQLRAHQQFVEAVQDETADLFYDIFRSPSDIWENTLDTMTDYFYRTMAQWAAKAVAEPIIVPVIQSVGSGLTGAVTRAAGGDDGFGMDMFSAGKSLWGAFTGGTSNSVAGLLNSGPVSSIGSGIFGSAWGTYGAVEAGTGAISAGTAGAGTFASSGIVGALSTAAPYLAIAAAAVPLISKLLEDDPVPAIGIQGGHWGTENPGQGSYNSKLYNYKLFAQDMGGETSAAFRDFFDQRFALVDETLGGALAETFRKYDAGAVNSGWVYTEGMEADAALEAVSRNVFAGIIDGLKTESLGAGYDLFDLSFFESIRAGGEDLFETYLGFYEVANSTDAFIAKITRQVSEFGESTISAYSNIATITGLMADADTALSGITNVSSITTLDNLTASWQAMMDAMDAAHATLDQLTQAEAARGNVLGSAITGLTADALAASLASGGGVDAIMTQSLDNLIYSTIARQIADTYFSGLNQAVADVWLETGDLSAVIDAMQDIDTSAAAAEIRNLQAQFGTLSTSASTATSNLTDALSREISTQRSQLDVLQSNLDTARENYLDAINAEIDLQAAARDAAERTADSFRNLASSLADARGDILADVADPAQKTALAKEAYEKAMQGAWAKDEDAMAALPGLARTYLSAAGDTLGAVEMNSLTAAVLAQLSSAEGIAGAQATAADLKADAAQTQIDVLTAQRNDISGMADSLLTMDAAADQYYAAQLALDTSGLETQINYYEAQLEQLESLNTNILSLAQARTEYNQATVAVQEASGNYTFDDEIYYQNKMAQLNANLATAEGQATAAKYNVTGLWSLTDVMSAFAREGFTARKHYDLYGMGEGVSPYAVQGVGYADGGISSGPSTGYYELLHGTEAIIPLGKGTLSLQIQGDGSGTALAQEVIQFRTMAEEYLYEMTASLKTIVNKLERLERQGIKINEAG